MYKPQFRRTSDIFAIIDRNGVMSYVSFNMFRALHRIPEVQRVDISFHGNILIDDRTAEDIKAFGKDYTTQELAAAIEGFLPHKVTWSTLGELVKRVSKVLSIHLLIIL